MFNLKIGIWWIEDGLIRCVKDKNVDRYINGTDVNEKRTISNTTFWALPIHLALKEWTTLDEMKDLLQIMAIMRCNLNLPQNHTMDLQTWTIVQAIILNKEKGLV
ncbi:hypothetical protein [Salinimicrobium sp. GXAS 041]|uniref:hypothetical protein n=1 Tax=Salinimicrobium sp. GXAS 041 TaxID=3400806 RepID=UPI003C764E63